MKERRLIALRAACPTCGAVAGKPCIGTRSERKAPHRDRLKAGKAAPPLPVVKPAVGFYDSPEWRRLRYQALKAHGGACQCCGARGSREKPLHVDHIKPRSRFPDLELTLSNLQVLCADCNLGKSAWDATDWRPTEGGSP